MFERFTDRARRVRVYAQEEAHLLSLGFLGTEHILLGLLHEGEGVAAQALTRLDISLEDVRRGVREVLGLPETVPAQSTPFTPRAKKVLELSLREALQLGDSDIDTEHLLLGIVREGEGVGAEVLVSLGADLLRVRQTVIQLLRGPSPEEATPEVHPLSPLTSTVTAREPGARLMACSFCGRQPPDTGRLVAGAEAFICEHCIRDWSEQLVAEQREPGDQ